MRLQGDTALLRGRRLAGARNDVLANLLIWLLVVTVFWFSPWPDIAVGLVIGTINLFAAGEVRAGAAENPELELEDDD